MKFIFFTLLLSISIDVYGQISPKLFIGNDLPQFNDSLYFEGTEFKVIGESSYISFNGHWVENVNRIQILSNYDELRNLNNGSMNLVLVENFDNVTGGLFYKSNFFMTEDRGTTINGSDSTTWKRVFNDASGVNVDWFEISDNTERFNFAISRADFYNTYLSVPGKEYKFETSMIDSFGYYLIATSRTSIYGNDSTLLRYIGSDPVSVLRVIDADKIKIENFNVQFDNQIFSSISIHSLNSKNSIITNCKFKGGHWGMLLANESNNNEINSITSSCDFGGHNIEINGSSYNHVFNCNLYNSYGTVSVPGNNIEIYSKPELGIISQFNLIENNDCRHGSAGVVIIGASNNTIRNNYISDQRIAGVAAFNHDVYGTPSDGNQFINNDIYNCGNLDVVSAGIVIHGNKNVVTSNRVYNSGNSVLDSDGIAVYGNQTLISQNEVFENYGHGIKIGLSDGSILKENLIYNNSNIGEFGRDGIRVFSCSNLYISNNTIYDNRSFKKQNFGIFIDSESNFSHLLNNRAYDNLTHNIYNTNTTSRIISDCTNILGQTGGINVYSSHITALAQQSSFDISLGKGISYMPISDLSKVDVELIVNGLYWTPVSHNILNSQEYYYDGTLLYTEPMVGGEKIIIKAKY